MTTARGLPDRLCPLFGSRGNPRSEEAKRRTALRSGRCLPAGMCASRPATTKGRAALPASMWGRERRAIYQRECILSIPFDKLGMPPPSVSPRTCHRSPRACSTLYSYMALPAVVIGGLTWLVKRNGRRGRRRRMSRYQPLRRRVVAAVRVSRGDRADRPLFPRRALHQRNGRVTNLNGGFPQHLGGPRHRGRHALACGG